MATWPIHGMLQIKSRDARHEQRRALVPTRERPQAIVPGAMTGGGISGILPNDRGQFAGLDLCEFDCPLGHSATRVPQVAVTSN